VQLRAFLGYSGWSGGQLENELKQNTWVVTPVVSGALNNPHDATLWKTVLGNISAEWKLLANEPEDVENN
jgi:putative transcriptional regulator